MNSDEVIRPDIVTGKEILSLKPIEQLVYLGQMVNTLPKVINGFSSDGRIAEVVDREGGFYSQARDFTSVEGYDTGFYSMCVMASILNYWRFKDMDGYIPMNVATSDKADLGKQMAYRAGALWGDFCHRTGHDVNRATSAKSVFDWLGENEILKIRHVSEYNSPLRLAYTLLRGGGAVIYGRAPYTSVAVGMDRTSPYNVTFVDSHSNPAGVAKVPFVEIFNPNTDMGIVSYDRDLQGRMAAFRQVELMYPQVGLGGALETTPWDEFSEWMRPQVFKPEKGEVDFKPARQIFKIKV